ncbi:MAG: hypothetical protein GY841_11220, partial [FCB group bacterium]|nr:hypothetical protein [FCB group bacterium]
GMLTEIFKNWHMHKRFDEILAYTLGEKIEKISDKWTYYLKKKYYPQISDYDLPDKDAVRLTRREFAVRPVPVQLVNDRGELEEWVIYKANRVGYSAIYMMPADGDKKRAVTLLKGERSAEFESLHLLTSGVDQFDNRLLAFSSKSKERDVLYIYDLPQRKVTQKYEFTDLAAVSSPRFSPDGSHIVFTGNRNSGYADLYLLDLVSGQLRQLTDDIYNDLDPCFEHDGRTIVFSSDRGEDGYEGFHSLYRLDISGGGLKRLTFGRFHDRGPSASPDGSQIVFSSDRGEIEAFNIFSLKRDGRLERVTEYITGAFDPRFGADGKELYFSAYQNRGFHVFKVAPQETTPVVANYAPTINGRWSPGRLNAQTGAAAVKYQTDYSLDIAQSVVAYDGVFGTIGGIQAAVSDVLGNNTFIILLSNTARDKSNLLSSFNVGVNYLRRTSRLNWGFGAFHLYNEYYNDFDGYYFERLIGGALYASYPISKFDRIESSVFLRHSDKDIFDRRNRRKAILVTQLFSLVTDNTLWEPTGPLEGRRINLTIGHTFDLKSGRNFSRQASIDARHYLRLRLFSSIASRVFAYTSAGKEPQRIYLGGSWSFRGFSRRHFYNRNILFNSEEIRFPLINDLVLGFPIGTFHLRGIRGALFHDAGTAWDSKWRGWKGSFGASVRIALGYLVVLRFDFSRTHDFRTVSDFTRTDFFFGWNF